MVNKKAAIELSMNFLVIIIISIVILGSGIYLTRQIFTGAQETSATLDERTKEAILHYGANWRSHPGLPSITRRRNFSKYAVAEKPVYLARR